MISFDEVEEFLPEARGIAFDGCHKIYVLMDDAQMEKMKGYGYEKLVSADMLTDDELLVTIKEWYAESCMLRFVSAVETVEGDANEGFTDLIAQGESDDDDEDDYEYEDDGEYEEDEDE